MAYDLATVTNSGNQLLASVASDHSSLVIDKIEVSGTKLASSTDLKSMTSISNVVKTLSANGYQKKDNSFIISTVLDNSSVKVDYQAWVFGIWAHKDDGGSSILMSVITSTDSPDTISKGSGTPIDYNYKFVTTFSNTKSLKIKMSSDTYATNDTVLHNSGDETATGTKTFQEIKISNKKFPSLVQTDGQYVTLDGGNSEMIPVTDNHDGTEQLNGVKVQPFNKLSDTIGGRNLVKDSEQEISGQAYGFHDYPLASLTELTPGKTYTVSCSAKVDDKAVNCKQFLFIDIYDPSWHWSIGIHAIVPISTDYQRGAYTFTIPEGQTGVTMVSAYLMHPTINGKLDGSAVAGTGYIKELKLERGSIATDWTPAPEDKVNVSDMRKPASDVAGIEEVVHDNHDNTITANNVKYDLSRTGLTPITTIINSGSFNDLPLGTVFASASVITDGPDTAHGFTTTTFYFSGWSGRKAQIAIADNVNLMYFRVYMGIYWTSWTLLSDDSKVVHLSGANNFDTVPTVNNNQLLLVNYYTVDLTDAKYDRNKWYYVEANSYPSGSLGGSSYFSLEAPFAGIDVPYGAHGYSDNTIKDACARQIVLYGQGRWGTYDHKLTVLDDQTRWTTDGKRLLTFVVPSDNNLNYAFYARGGLKINIVSDVSGLTWTPHTDTFVENGTTISVLNDAPDPKALGLDDDHTFWALPMSQFNQQLKSKVTDNKNGTIEVNGSSITPADDSKVAHLSGANNFDTVPTVKNNPLLLASSLPSDLARTGQANTFSSLQTFSQGVKTLQTGSYDDANSLVNEGLYYNTNSSIKNGAASLTTGYIQVMSGGGEIVRQIMYSDTDGGVIYDRTSQDGGSSWGNWVHIVTWNQIPSNIVLNNQDTNFTAKLQQNGQDVALANNTLARNPDTGSVSSANTFTAAQTFSIAPTITDASQDKGDNQAATMADLKSVENSAWRPLIKNFDTNYFQNEKYYNFNAFIKVSGGKAQIVGYLQDRSDSSYPFGTYIRLANLPSGISFQNDINNLGFTIQGILSSSSDDKTYYAAVDGTINAHSSDNSIGIIFQKDSNFNTNADWFQPGTYGAMESYPTWTINGMTSDIKLSD